MSEVSTQRFTGLNALGALLWATVLAVAGYLLGNLLEAVLGDLGAIEKPLLIGIVLFTLAWIAWRHGRDHLIRAAPGPQPGAQG
jgi:membrane protein DedA with SNARE-associated domain